MKFKLHFLPILLSPVCVVACDSTFSTSGKIVNFEYYHVSDGDTIYLNYNNKRTGIRFLGIDTPETKKAHNVIATLENAYAQKAKQALIKLLNNKPIKIQIISIDRYNRLVARVWNYQNIDANIYLVSNGLARVKYLDKKRSNINYWNNNWKIKAYYDKLVAAESMAKRNKIGIWKYKIGDIFYKK
ncbi:MULTISPECIES: thermonuclease family protein [unclassified Mycoplasma]|uniref:thermonuclease family protein n=1 Tax=unclassified Mycoplasma TaxID=2683645 RepID=UPI00216B6195|nr:MULTISPECIES: thermonuclease family protein [unclassified Mycoplasma]MCS4536672.1 thermonuclease family protein [Mycoplasma sp. CSL7475-4]MCT4469973.1 thermonuclease family protein [Mycoplasma sp. HS2188]